MRAENECVRIVNHRWGFNGGGVWPKATRKSLWVHTLPDPAYVRTHMSEYRESTAYLLGFISELAWLRAVAVRRGIMVTTRIPRTHT